MSERNYSPFQGPLGVYRREVPVPDVVPDIDIDQLTDLRQWREEVYKQPFLDKLNGHYRFYPSPRGALAYAGMNEFARLDRLNLHADREAARRQVTHVAEGAEQATALFWSVASLRHTAISHTLSRIIQTTPEEFYGELASLPETDPDELDQGAAVFAADAIVDLGLCIEKPYENNFFWHFGGSKRAPHGLDNELERRAPGMGAKIASFGAFAVDHSAALRSADGIILLQTALEEQEMRINTWQPRHEALVRAFPQVEVSEEVLLMHLPLGAMLQIQSEMQIDDTKTGKKAS